ncbi:MAG: hypothetical protein JNM94_10670 [Phycisphaerae bacterium]|nr:hypothetical protein [Phycisphaerae bacterium]
MRRGNTLVLVTAILVLLVIVAVAFISRTQAGRQVSAAQQASDSNEQRVMTIAEDLAALPADALFARPVDPSALNLLGGGYRQGPSIYDPSKTVATATSGFARLNAPPDARIFGIDRDFNNDLFPDFPYNFAPYHTVPWTNWPDFLSPNMPRGAGQPDGIIAGQGGGPIGDENTLGNPGYGDTRWLASTEPVRGDSNGDGVPDVLTHYAHLSFIGNDTNGYRLVADISDISNNTLFNINEGDLTKPFALGMPYEQWLPNFVPPQGIPSANQFNALRNAWFAAPGAGASYLTNYASNSALPNLFRLADLDPIAPGIPNPAAAFVNGTTRNAVERTFTDTDGDGFTDAQWFVAPTPVDRSVRYLVAARIMPNSALLNVNAATRFNYQNSIGVGPSDLALIGNPDVFGLQVGMFDNPANSYPSGTPNYPTLFNVNDGGTPGLYGAAKIAWDRNRFGDTSTDSLTFLQQVGMKRPDGSVNAFLADTTYNTGQQAEWFSPSERLLYWKNGALRGNDPRLGITPFGVADELELRGYASSNNPFELSRLERAINRQGDVFQNWLRSTPEREETSEYLDALSNRGVMLDNRRKLTTVSGARNDLRPAWLWPSPFANPSIDYNADGLTGDTDGNYATIENPVAGNLDFQSYVAQTKKFDLRAAMDQPIVDLASGTVTVPTAATIESRRYEWRVQLQRLLEQTLTRSWLVPGSTTLTQYQSYFGSPVNTNSQYQRQQYDKTRSAAASFAANIDQVRDGPTVFGVGNNLIVRDEPLHPAVGVQDPIDGDLRYIGMEKQPYIMEVFTALVYPKAKLDPALKTELQNAGIPVGNDYVLPNIFAGGGEHWVDSSVKPGVVIAVQIANPYDTPISLLDYRLRMFGKSYQFTTGTYGPGVFLGPATEGRPTTAIVYAIKESPDGQAAPAGFGFVQTWLDFLDIEATELYDGQGNPDAVTRIFDASGSAWSSLLNANAPTEGPSELNDDNGDSVELVRVISPPAGLGSVQPATVVIDRFDNRETGPKIDYAQALSRLFTEDGRYPPKAGFDFDVNNPPDRNYVNGIRIGTDDYFVAWVRASRPWTWDVIKSPAPFDRKLTADELSPRYVFSVGSEPALSVKTQNGNFEGQDKSFKGDTYAFNQDPDGTNLWMSLSYRSIFDEERRGKPTNFPCVTREQPGVADNVYGQGFPYPDPATLAYPANVTVGDKMMAASDWSDFDTYTALKAPFQMLQKDADFDQIGELLNVFVWGHVLDIGPGVTTPETVRTFSEILLQNKDTDDQPAGAGVFVNRIRITPFADQTTPTGIATTILSTPPNAPYVPSLPAGAGLFDAVVCDDRGLRRLDGLDGSAPDGVIQQAEIDEAEFLRPRNAGGFEGVVTPGLIDISNALPEVLAVMPHMTRIQNNDADFDPATGGGSVDQLSIAYSLNPFVRVVDSILRYRDRTTDPVSGTINPFPLPAYPAGYVERGLADGNAAAPIPPGLPNTTGFMGPTASGQVANGILPGLRGERGFASLGELLLMQRIAQDPSDSVDAWDAVRSYSIEFAGLDPYRVSEANVGTNGVEYVNSISPRLSTDVNNGRKELNPNVATPTRVPDRVGGDAEERNLLFSGISNLATTRSDIFTIYFRVRAVKQDPTTGVWNGAREDLIVDDARYVMIVDRSNVRKPGDKPRILAMRKIGS